MQWINSLVSEYDARPLQKSGMLTKEQLLQFFQESAKQFTNPEFKELLSVALKTRGPGAPEEMINGMQKQIFESMGVQGDFGINCLGRVNQVYGGDAFFIRNFFEHVQKEEMVLDEAEMPVEMFKSKYDQLNNFRKEMEARLQKLEGMTPEEQNVYMSNIYKEMITMQSGGGECCSHPGSCSHRHGGDAAAPPAPMEGPAGLTLPAGGPAATGPGAMGPALPASSAMTEAEQLAFFAGLSGPGAKQ